MQKANPIFTAIERRDVHLVRELLDVEPALVDAKLEGSEETPLHFASDLGLQDIVKLLVERGADVNAQAFYHYTPLTSAVRSGQKEVAEFLRAKRGEEYD